jgi:methylated-DNA-protein-cysteine methyltransferase-like protein
MTSSFEDAVIATIRRLRPGEVASYGEVAEEAGFKGAARAVGAVLARSSGLPWWRVVRADGRLVSPKEEEQARRLQKEGVVVERGRVRPVGSAPSRRSK